jgi:hypothetical protein
VLGDRYCLAVNAGNRQAGFLQRETFDSFLEFRRQVLWVLVAPCAACQPRQSVLAITVYPTPCSPMGYASFSGDFCQGDIALKVWT